MGWRKWNIILVSMNNERADALENSGIDELSEGR